MNQTILTNPPVWMDLCGATEIIKKAGERAGLKLNILLDNSPSYPMDIISSEGWGICWYTTTGTVCAAAAFDKETGVITKTWPSRSLLRYPESQDRMRKCTVNRAEDMVPFILDHLPQIRKLHERVKRK